METVREDISYVCLLTQLSREAALSIMEMVKRVLYSYLILTQLSREAALSSSFCCSVSPIPPGLPNSSTRLLVSDSSSSVSRGCGEIICTSECMYT